MGEGRGTSIEKRSLLDILNSWNARAYYWTFVAGISATTTYDSIQQEDLKASLFRGGIFLLSLGFANYSHKKSRQEYREY